MTLQKLIDKTLEKRGKASKGRWDWLDSAGRTIIRTDKPLTGHDCLFVYPYKDRHEGEYRSNDDAAFTSHAANEMANLALAARKLAKALEFYATATETKKTASMMGDYTPFFIDRGAMAKAALAAADKLCGGGGK